MLTLAPKDFFRGATGSFPEVAKNISQGMPKMVKLRFSFSKLGKQPFLLKM